MQFRPSCCGSLAKQMSTDDHGPLQGLTQKGQGVNMGASSLMISVEKTGVLVPQLTMVVSSVACFPTY
jgi:hypothetical protein